MIISKCIKDENKEEFFKKCIYYILTCLGVAQNEKINWHTHQEEVEHAALVTKNGKITRIMTTEQAEQNYADIVINLYNELQYYNKSKKTRKKSK